MPTVLGIHDAPRPHWVGDGFPVRSLFEYSRLGKALSPFLLLDYAGPARFEPATQARGVGEHPHRGFETVTIVYAGEVAHRDSTGQGGVIGPGDVQWMTAGAGILHEEFHSDTFTQTGGELEMVQLWVNLPARDKRVAPGYQAINAQDIPVVELSGGAGSVRVIAGDYLGHTGPARTHSPMQVWDVRLAAGGVAALDLPAGWNAALAVLHGRVRINHETTAHDAQLVQLDRSGGALHLEAETETSLLLLAGEPLDEPIVGYGPFVMNSEAEINEAIADFKNGRFGHMPDHHADSRR
ncbi:MAG: pirin family protein [Thiobacillus sp.]